MEIRQPSPDEHDRIGTELLRPGYREAEAREPEYCNLTEQARTSPSLDSWLDADDRTILVAIAETEDARNDGDTDGELAGNVSGAVSPTPPIYDRPPVVYCDGLYVKPEYRREGVATDLLDRLVEWGRERGCGFFSLSVHVDNESATEFFEDYGMEQAYRSMRTSI